MTDYKSRKPYLPSLGEILENEGGGLFQVTDIVSARSRIVRVVNLKSNWSCQAYGIGRYSNGLVDWDYSRYGYFLDPDSVIDNSKTVLRS